MPNGTGFIVQCYTNIPLFALWEYLMAVTLRRGNADSDAPASRNAGAWEPGVFWGIFVACFLSAARAGYGFLEIKFPIYVAIRLR